MFRTADGVYETENWQLIFSLEDLEDSGFFGVFSNDSTLLAVGGHGVFDTATWQKRFDIPANSRVTFSPDGRWLLVGADVYDPQTGEIVHSFPGSPLYPNFSPDGTMMADGDRIFDTTTWQELYYVSDPAYFSPDSRYAVMRFRGVIDTSTGEPAAPQTQFSDYSDFDISPDSKMIAFGSDEGTVQDMETGTILFGFEGNPPAFNPESLLLATISGVYETQAGTLLYEFPFGGGPPDNFVEFNSDNTILGLRPSIFGGGGSYCALYGIQGTPWPYRSGLAVIKTKGINPVYATTPDRNWLRVREQQWVPAADVEIIYLPDGIPIETPGEED